MKKILSCLILLLAMLPFLAMDADAATIVDSGYCGDNLKWKLDDEDVLTIYGTGGMRDFSDYYTPWDFYESSIRTVVIEPGVTRIGAYAFYNCYRMTNIYIPEGVTSIREYAFRYCNSLTWVTIPEGVTSIEQGAFSSCKNLAGISIPQSLTDIGSDAFYNCNNLQGVYITDIIAWLTMHYGNSYACPGADLYLNGNLVTDLVIPEGIDGITAGAFRDCSSLRSVHIPSTALYIGDEAFYGCSNLIGVIIPEGVSYIGYSAFSGCSSMQWVNIPTSVTNIDTNTFYNCYNLENVIYNGNRVMWEAINKESGNQVLYYANILTNETPFWDISATDYYYDPILWALSKGITTGVDANHFAPDATCTRGQIVTFLWRANGSPKPKSSNNPFCDVTPDDYFYNAVLWAVQNGITSGISADNFAPNDPCTRGQVATFLWRSKSKPAPGGVNSFYDVTPGAYYYDAVLWAVANGVTNGIGNGSFAPDAPCTRGQIVTFLCRAMK